MAVPARYLEVEITMEERVARLEVNVAHLQSDVTEVKTALHRLNEKVDALAASVSSLRVEMTQSINALRVELRDTASSVRAEMKDTASAIRAEMRDTASAIRAEMKDTANAIRQEMAASEKRLWDAINDLKVSRWIDRVWWLAIAGALLGVMARGFKWI